MCIGGYAVNFFSYHRVTEDMDIWMAPTNENKTSLINTLMCIRYSESEIAYIVDEDFTTYFMIVSAGNETPLPPAKRLMGYCTARRIANKK